MYQPKYTITNKILKNIGAIEAAKETIENAPLVPFYEKKFQTDAVARTVHHGTHIEGNDLSMTQTLKVLEGEEIVAKDRDVQEVINYRRVIKLLDKLAKKDKYTLAELKKLHAETIHKVVNDEQSGEFRKVQVVIREEGEGKVVLQPPPFVEVPFLLEDFFEWLNSKEAREVHPVILAGISHYILVSIHPFVEGNGRTVRAFASLILLRENYDIKRFFALEEHFDKDPAAYYEAFAKVDKQSKNIAARDMTVWLEYFTKVVAVELTKIKEEVRKLSIDSSLKLKIGKQVALTQRQMKLVEYLSQEGSAKMQDLKQVLTMVSEDTILRDLKDLIKKGIVKKKGRTKASRYLINK